MPLDMPIETLITIPGLIVFLKYLWIPAIKKLLPKYLGVDVHGKRTLLVAMISGPVWALLAHLALQHKFEESLASSLVVGLMSAILSVLVNEGTKVVKNYFTKTNGGEN